MDFLPLELPQEFFDDGNRIALKEARCNPVKILVSVLFLVRPGLPESAVTWEPEFGDMMGVDQIMDTMEELKPFLRPGENLTFRTMEAK